MARVKMVTRTIKGTEVTMITLDVATMQPMTQNVVLGVDTNDIKILEKVAKSIHEIDTIKVVSVSFVKSIEKLYGMTESVFMEHAIELDPDTRKAIESDDEIEE